MSQPTESSSKPVVLVTGASGLLGSRLVRALQDRYRVVQMDVEPPDVVAARGSFVPCDLTDDTSVEQALGHVRDRYGESIASTVHLAAYYDFSGEPSPLYDELTVNGTKRLLKALQRFDVGQFIFSSTLLVMKPSNDGRAIAEGSPTEVTWDYPESKLETEQVIAEERGSIPSVVLRIAGVYDDELGRSPAITEHIKRIYAKDFTSYFFPGNAERGQAFVHIDDAVDAIVHTVDARTELGGHEVFLISEPSPVPYQRLQEMIGEQIHGKEWPTLRVPKPVAKAGAWVQDKLSGSDDEPFIKPFMVDIADAHYPVDISRAQSRLHWSPRHDLLTTLPEIVGNMLQAPAQWFERNGMAPPKQAEQERA